MSIKSSHHSPSSMTSFETWSNFTSHSFDTLKRSFDKKVAKQSHDPVNDANCHHFTRYS